MLAIVGAGLLIIHHVLDSLLKYRQDRVSLRGYRLLLFVVIALIAVILVIINCYSNWRSGHEQTQQQAKLEQRLEDVNHQNEKLHTQLTDLERLCAPFIRAAESQFSSIHGDEAARVLAAQFQNPRDELANMLTEINSNAKMLVADGLRIMMLTGQLIESENEHLHYPMTNLYCEWCTRYRPYRMYAGWNMLLDAADLLIRLINDHDPNASRQASVEISKLFSLEHCRREMRELYAAHRLSPLLFSDDNWRNFASTFMIEMRGKPIEFPSDVDEMPPQLSARYKSLKATAGKEFRWFPKSMWLGSGSGGVFAKDTILWAIKLETGTTFEGQLMIQ